MYGRAANQRREERAALADALVCCARCACSSRTPAAVVHAVGARFLADSSALQDDLLSDFVEMSRSHVLLPPRRREEPVAPARAGQMSAEDGPYRSLLGRHSIHLPVAALATRQAIACSLAEAFRAPLPSPTAPPGSAPDVSAFWTTVRCAGCQSTLGAVQLEALATAAGDWAPQDAAGRQVTALEPLGKLDAAPLPSCGPRHAATSTSCVRRPSCEGTAPEKELELRLR